MAGLNALVLLSLWQRLWVSEATRLTLTPGPPGTRKGGWRGGSLGLPALNHPLPGSASPSCPLSGLVPEPPDQVEEETRGRDGHGQEETGLGDRAAQGDFGERGGGRRLQQASGPEL